MTFWGELKRRNVFKVGVAYVIAAWLIVQVANTFFPLLHLPQWTVTFVAVLLILGLPVALILAWAYELTPEGVKLTKKVPLAESITHVTGRKLNYVLIGVIVLAVAYILFDNLYLDRRATIQTAEVASRVAELAPPTADIEETPKTIAVLPFADLSPANDQKYFVDGLIEELLNSLAQIPDLNVTGRTSSFSFKGSNKTVQEIAGVLGVENILEGSVRKAGNALRITAQLLRGSDGFHLWSKTYDRELKDIFAVQEDIATAIADELKVTLGIGKPFKQLGGTDNVEAYELYLTAKAQFYEIGIDFRVPKLKIDAALELDPDFALAWALKASIYQTISGFVFGDQSVKELDESLKAAQRAIELEPNLAEAHIALGDYRMSRGDWIEAELAYRKARDLGGQSALVNGSYIPYLGAVGYLDKANKILKEALRNDPLNQVIRVMYANSFILLGDRQKAEEQNDRYKKLFGFAGGAGIYYLRINFNELVLDDVVGSPRFSEEQIERIKSPEDLLAELRRIYVDPKEPSLFRPGDAAEAAYFGDPELALKIIERLIIKEESLYNILGNLFGIGCWYPVMHEVRQLPRFKELVREIGLVDYWEQFGWPDLCKPTVNGDFVCD